MEKLSFKSCFIFNPNLKSLLKKPTDDDKQDAKLLVYYPSCEEILIKRSNMGIIEGTIQFNHSFNNLQEKKNSKKDKTNDEFLLTELNSLYYFSQKFEDEYYIAISVDKNKKNKILNLNENVNYRVSLFKEILFNFYNYFYLFHGSFKENFFPGDADIRGDKDKFNYVTTVFSDFITCYFDFIGNYNINEILYQSPITDGILYSTCTVYPNLLFSVLRLNEKYRDIRAISLVYKGFLIHNEIDVDEMALLYNMMYNNINGDDYFDKFRYPIFLEETDKNEIKEEDKNKNENTNANLVTNLPLASSPFFKGFVNNNKNAKKNSNLNNNNFFMGCDLFNRKVFIPLLHFNKSSQKKMKLMIFNIKELNIFLFFDENFEIKDSDSFEQLAVFLDICFKDSLTELKKINFEDKTKEIKKEFDFVYYNKQNKSFKLSYSFYTKNTNELDKSKIPILEKIKELMMSKRIKKSVTKIEGQYLYYFEQFQKNVAIILKENKPIEEVKVKYFNKIIKTIEFY